MLLPGALGWLCALACGFEMLAGGPKRDPRQTAGDRENDFVDPRFVEQLEHDVESVALILRAVRVRADGDADAARLRLAHQRALASRYFFFAVVRVVAIEKARVDLDGQAAPMRYVEHAIFVLFELLLRGPRPNVAGA